MTAPWPLGRYVLETVDGAVRRLEKISNCAFQCHDDDDDDDDDDGDDDYHHHHHWGVCCLLFA